MIKRIFIIIVLLAANAGVGYYGYNFYKTAGAGDAFAAEELFAEMDQGIIDINASSPTDEEIAEIEGVPTDDTPVTTESMDALISEIDTVGASDTSGFSATLNDL
jgi:hypothetical protein